MDSRTRISLNGQWQLQQSNDESLPTKWEHAVPVPALVDIASPRYDWKAFKYHYYRTTFDLPATGQDSRATNSFIVIEQAMFGTDVWLNGVYLGGDIACYTSQEYDAGGALKSGVNALIVRVGRREHLPPESAVGNDQERTEWIPGIWGDVYLRQCGNPRIKHVQVIPHIDTSTAEVRVTVENRSASIADATLSTIVREKMSRKHVSETMKREITLSPNVAEVVIFTQTLNDMHLWSFDSPFLYELETQTADSEQLVDYCATTFGMREFKIIGRHFYLNGKQILLRGGNIAFHRFLSDADRGTLPWNLDWVKKVLVDIPKAHNFNFFRNHIGHLYNRWYDIADEHGMLLHNEWMFWTTTGTKEQIRNEFSRWLQDNWNHPSIVMWDALNECSDDVVQKEIVPEMKKLDPTRPWESVDFVEEHPYIYSLGPVLNDRKLGFTRSLEEIESATKPTMLNEFCWWWLDKDYQPRSLMNGVIERWLGPRWTKDELIHHQTFLVTELVELFRRMRVDAIQPFVYLSNNAGPTANWFVGDIKDLQPKPILAALKNAFAPFGISIELWDRHFFPSEHRMIRVFVFNDEPVRREGLVRCGILNAKNEWLFDTTQVVTVEPSSIAIMPLPKIMPTNAGEYHMRSELLQDGRVVAYSEKMVHVVSQPEAPASVRKKHFALLASGDELRAFIAAQQIPCSNFLESNREEWDALIVEGEMVRSSVYQSRLGAISRLLESGKTVVLLEPEFGIEESEVVPVVLGVELKIEKRVDADKGGYDSYIFADDIAHPLWQGLSPEHLKMFNGAYGGEIVSQHNVTTNAPHAILARCGLHLAVNVVIEIPVGKGRILVSRIQSRGRLEKRREPDSLFARRVDPVVQHLVVNLLSYAGAGR
jgi:hypothetical protein